MKTILRFSLMMILALCFMCDSAGDEETATGPSEPDAEGFITVTAAGVTLRYRVDGDSLRCILSAQTTGWVAVGFNPSSRMKDANFILGYVDNGTVTVRDDWGTQEMSHQADVDLGGRANVRAIQGQETSGITEVEFIIPLDSGDAFDRALTVGQSYPVLLARSGMDDINVQHSNRDQTTITL